MIADLCAIKEGIICQKRGLVFAPPIIRLGIIISRRKFRWLAPHRDAADEVEGGGGTFSKSDDTTKEVREFMWR